jgi:hypothetical protein
MANILLDLYRNATFVNVSLGFIAYLIARALYQVVYYRFFHPLSKFPGPFWGSVTRLWIAYHNIKEDEPYVEHELHKKYGMRLSVALNAHCRKADMLCDDRTYHSNYSHLAAGQLCARPADNLSQTSRQDKALHQWQFWRN